MTWPIKANLMWKGSHEFVIYLTDLANSITRTHNIGRITSNMNSTFKIKEELEIFEEEILQHYPTPIKKEFKALKCEKIKADEIIPSCWLQEPIDIPIYSDGEENICLICNYVEGAPLTSHMKRKKAYHNKWCLTQQHLCTGCGLNISTEPRTRIQKSMERSHIQSCLMKMK